MGFRLHRVLAAGFAVAATVATIAVPAAVTGKTTTAEAAPTSFQLVFEGSHRPATMPNLSGLQHEGPFTASAPFCSSGTAVDIAFVRNGASRRYTCDDGSGTIVARVDPLAAEHGDASGRWWIEEGTGQYATLRGKGTWTSELISGDPSDPSRWHTVVYRTTLKAVVDFDVVAPKITILAARATRLAPSHVYLLRVTFAARDNIAGNVVAYRVAATAGGRAVAAKAGNTTGGTVSLVRRIRAPKGARTVKLYIVASDPLEHERSLTRSVRLRR